MPTLCMDMPVSFLGIVATQSSVAHRDSYDAFACAGVPSFGGAEGSVERHPVRA